jgi:hypothetical protein
VEWYLWESLRQYCVEQWERGGVAGADRLAGANRLAGADRDMYMFPEIGKQNGPSNSLKYPLHA